VSGTHLAWRAAAGSPYIPSPLFHERYLYLVNDMVSVARCYEAKSGKLIWQERLGTSVAHGFSASPVTVGGKLFFTNDAGATSGPTIPRRRFTRSPSTASPTATCLAT
jgi:outer membrane protein assembly factor BamB